MPKRDAPTRQKKSPTGDYTVGYCKPPEATRFQRGTSGRPQGKSLKRDELPPVDRVMLEKHNIIVKGKKRRESTEFLALFALGRKAINGDLAAAKYLMGHPDRGKVMRAEQANWNARLTAKLNKLTLEQLEQLEKISAAMNGDEENDPPSETFDEPTRLPRTASRPDD